MKKFGLLAGMMTIVVLGACESSETSGESNYPTRDINGIIQWGEGGATDNVARSLAIQAEDALDASFVMQNREGATGAIATQYVYDQPADGYNVLFGAENPLIYNVLGISERDYIEDFYPVNIIGQGLAGVVVKDDSPFETLEDLVEHAQDNPGDLTLGTSGEGGLPHVVASMLSAELGTEFNQVPYDGDGPLFTAMLGDQIDATVVGVAGAQEYVEAGDIRMLSIVHNEEVEAWDAPALSDIYPEFDKYLPWGPFYGAFVHPETPDDVKETLVSAFNEAVEEESFQELLASLGAEPINISGDEAVDWMRQTQAVSAWLLYDAGATENSPEEFDIPRVEDID
ncbi:tricarboxylate transport protein TctC [Geomicrobium sp. JCM 19037]|uniref:tripartite tricarboxylate transporter substrate binding protein n=1 Tax=unclassified Geomicrobium TaxID=2628951 RepID=UPI00045F4410|nr:tripartite tricarboxylate transporter substrate binding protein [Geomicrobium sp. JCM 19037]GAK03468.1 tricarboxylate transport protein TctC [Geomicrobium sp. JCM 19037]